MGGGALIVGDATFELGGLSENIFWLVGLVSAGLAALTPSMASRLVAASGFTTLSSEEVVKLGAADPAVDEERKSKLDAVL